MKEIEPTKANSLCVVARRLYFHDFKEARRPDGSLVWQNGAAIANILSKAAQSGEISTLRQSNRRVFLLEDEAKGYINDYLSTRINSHGYTHLKLEDVAEGGIEETLDPVPATNTRFGWLARWMGIDKLYSVLKDISAQLIRVQEENEELKKLWQ